MQVDVLKAREGSPDGIQLVAYGPGVVEMPDELAAVFLAEGWARVPGVEADPEPKPDAKVEAPKRRAAARPRKRKA